MSAGSKPDVVAILDRASRLTGEEAQALDREVRKRPDLASLAASVLEEHQGWLNSWAMFDHWAHPTDEMIEVRRRVAVALGLQVPKHAGGLVPDDGSVFWGAATAAACAVLAAGNARYSVGVVSLLQEPWQSVLGR